MPRHNTLLSGVPGLKCDLLGRFTFDLRISSSGRVKIESMETERDTVASDAVTFTLERVAIPCSPARPPARRHGHAYQGVRRVGRRRRSTRPSSHPIPSSPSPPTSVVRASHYTLPRSWRGRPGTPGGCGTLLLPETCSFLRQFVLLIINLGLLKKVYNAYDILGSLVECL